MALTSFADATDAEPQAATEPEAGTSDPRFRRTGGNGFLGEAPDEQLWEQAGGFTSSTDDVKGRLDD